jgi:hypothetical protein
VKDHGKNGSHRSENFFARASACDRKIPDQRGEKKRSIAERLGQIRASTTAQNLATWAATS